MKSKPGKHGSMFFIIIMSLFGVAALALSGYSMSESAALAKAEQCTPCHGQAR